MKKPINLTVSLLLLMFTNGYSDEGMYPLSEINKLNVREKGFQLDVKDLYNPEGISLVDAVVSLGGCTGAFVSNAGLIITNHHCVFGFVQATSSVDHDYTTDGFLARTRGEEIQAKGASVRIIDSYRDVSNEVLSSLTEGIDVGERTKHITKKMKEIVLETEKNNPGKRAEVAEMFTGKSYVLFIYTYLKDIRLVYVPPRSIGEFGGEDDNWVWPRHTGDFSFIRAYVAPDGSPADYSPNNIPYTPKKFLRVQPNGVDENDFVFILGYPGRTYRHRTSHYLAYEEHIRMPFIADLYAWQIETMERMSKTDKAVAIKLTGRIKSLANTMKNYRGKLQGMKRLHLMEKKQEEERMLQSFIEEDKDRKAQYGTLLDDIKKVYDEMTASGQYEMVLDNMKLASMVSTAWTIVDASIERQKSDIDRSSAYMDRNFTRTKEGVLQGLKNFNEPTDKIFFKEMLMRASQLPSGQRINAVDDILSGQQDVEKAIDAFITNTYTQSRLNDEQVVKDLFEQSPEMVKKNDDPLIRFAQSLVPAYDELKKKRERRDGALSKLSALLIDVKQLYKSGDFIPDANSTFRLTFGRIKGYSPADAIYYSPLTTLRGVIEKSKSEPPYNTPAKTMELYKARDFGKFRNAKLDDIPVALLYDMDTTGGNSGSPVFNAKGELVGVNFDRAYEATINDYAWNKDYSRSIAVDIRYVLWVTEKIGGAEFLLKEMGVE